MGAEIFISYCRKDIAKAKRIKEEIEELTSVKCWMDIDGIESGSQFEDVIISAIDNSRIVVFLLSENSMKSNWTKDEVRYAYQTGKRIVPVNIDKCTPSGWFLFRFSGSDVIDFNDSLQKNKLFENLSRWITVKEKPVIVPSTPNKTTINIFYTLFWWCQYALFGLILLVFSSTFFFGMLSKPQGNIAFWYNVLLCICLCLTLYSLYLLSAKHKKKALFFICILDVIEIILLCVLSQRITGYALRTNQQYRSFPYVQINGLGWSMVQLGGLLVTFLMEVFAIIHISVLVGGLFVRIKGNRLWDKLK